MSTINTKADLLRLLREDAEFYDEVRRLILTDELIALPERFAAFAFRVDGFIVKQEQFNQRVDGFIAEQEQFNQRVDGFIVKQEQFNQRVDGFIVKQEQFNQRVDSRFDRIESDFSLFKNRFSESQVKEQADVIAMALGFNLLHTVTAAELVAMSRLPPAQDLPRNSLVSFSRADLILLVTDAAGEQQYLAVEISHSADERDTDRARRNADYLTQFTGITAHPAVASARNDRRIQPLIDNGSVRWYPLEDETGADQVSADEAEAEPAE